MINDSNLLIIIRSSASMLGRITVISADASTTTTFSGDEEAEGIIIGLFVVFTCSNCCSG